MKTEYAPTLNIAVHYTPELHEKIKTVVNRIEEMAKEHGVVPKMTPSFNTKPSTQYNRIASFTYFSSPSETIVVSTVLVESDFRKLDDMEWIEAISQQDNAMKAFHAELKTYMASLK